MIPIAMPTMPTMPAKFILLHLLLIALTIALTIAAIDQSAATPTPPLANSILSATPLPSKNTIATRTLPSINSTATLPASRYRDDSTREWFNGGTGCIYNDATHRCLDVEQSRQTPQSADAQMWRCNNNPNAQRLVLSWLHSVPQNVYLVRGWSRSGNKWYCLDVPGGNAFEGQIVRWWECNESNAQRWTVSRPDYWLDGHIRPLNRPDLCLDPRGGEGGDRDGQQMQLWRCLDNTWHQKWKMARWGDIACRLGPSGEGS